VRVHVSSVGPVELRFRAGSKRFKVDPPDPKVPLLAYGSTRRDTGRAPFEDRNIRIENLFDPTVPLCDADVWLKRLRKEDDKTFRGVWRAICRLLMLDERKGLLIHKRLGIPLIHQIGICFSCDNPGDRFRAGTRFACLHPIGHLTWRCGVENRWNPQQP
jgi:hypothetical protein